MFETPSPLLPTKNLLNEYNLGLRKNSSAHAKRFNELPLSPKKLTIYEQKISVESEESDNEEKVELEEHEKERIEKERVENLIKNLENWLCIDEENLFINNIEIEQHMKRDESLQILISFIVEPLKYLIDSLVIL